MAESKIINFRIDEESERDLERVMQEHRCSRSEAIRQAIIAYTRLIRGRQ